MHLARVNITALTAEKHTANGGSYDPILIYSNDSQLNDNIIWDQILCHIGPNHQDNITSDS